jgi:Uma2 family endonuclease
MTMAVAIRHPELRMVTADEQAFFDLDIIQGLWTVEQYLRLTNSSRLLLEFTDGMLEVLPVPTDRHQAILQFLLFVLHTFLQPQGGVVRVAPLRLQLREGKFREPDLLVLRDKSDPRRQNDYWRGADLVVEIVSPDNPERDTVVKRADYAEAGIPEYWIVQLDEETVTVLRFADGAYVPHGVFRRGDTLTSALLPEFTLAVTPIFDAQ